MRKKLLYIIIGAAVGLGIWFFGRLFLGLLWVFFLKPLLALVFIIGGGYIGYRLFKDQEKRMS